MTANDKKSLILLVEDDLDHVELTLRVLKELKVEHEIVVARDGAQALDFLLGGNMSVQPTLILLDLNMPKINGLDVLKRIRSEESTKRIPVVILTASREEKDVIDSYNLGANSYIIKPVDYEQFTIAVEQLGLYWLQLNIPPE
ncbi:MAG: response regulator [Candidatus Thorarchaeota archaeon]|nr:MAG: response regulator [Candidatus Thorarchaeota archaeon]